MWNLPQDWRNIIFLNCSINFCRHLFIVSHKMPPWVFHLSDSDKFSTIPKMTNRNVFQLRNLDRFETSLVRLQVSKSPQLWASCFREDRYYDSIFGARYWNSSVMERWWEGCGKGGWGVEWGGGEGLLSWLMNHFTWFS